MEQRYTKGIQGRTEKDYDERETGDRMYREEITDHTCENFYKQGYLYCDE